MESLKQRQAYLVTILWKLKNGLKVIVTIVETSKFNIIYLYIALTRI